MKRLTIATVVILVFFLILGITPTHGEEQIYEGVLRLHVLANSDSDEDQALKLKVRDAIVEFCTARLFDCKSRDEAETRLNGMMDEIRETAKAALRENGSDFEVRITLGEEDYPRRSYDRLCFPAGRYLSLRVLIGEGKGKNWWCVLFPPLCLGAATEQEQKDAFIAAGFTQNQYKVITESDKVTYKMRFKILEWLEALRKN